MRANLINFALMTFSATATLPFALIISGSVREIFKNLVIGFQLFSCWALATFAITCALSCIMVTIFGRKTLLLIGFSLLAVANLTMIILYMMSYEHRDLVYIGTTGFISMTTIGPTAWIYSAETQPDIGVGIQLALYMLILLCTSPFKQHIACHPMSYLLLCAVSILATAFVWIYMAETKNQT